LGAVYFAFQIYGDFSGYSDMALGCLNYLELICSKILITLIFSRDIAEFWRRWHISLSSWFRDYLYPTRRQGSKLMQVRNVFIFVVSGFWHGANWTIWLGDFWACIFYLYYF
jgi:D-alanyl-lipoteichoic acid acyltransferase DltB (MBOAT superfamily)